MERAIVVPLDGSTLAETILPHASALARLAEGGIVLVRAVPPPVIVEPLVGAVVPATPSFELWQEGVQEARSYLDTVAASPVLQGIPVKVEILEEYAASAIVSYAADNPNVAAIAMATHGRTGLSRWVFGSVAEKVLHSAPKPLLLVRPPKDYEAHPADTLKAQPASYKTILVPLDGSTFAEQALNHAELLAREAGAQIVLVSVTPEPEAPDRYGPTWTESALNAGVERVSQYLEDVAERLRSTGLQVQAKPVHGHPAEMILDAVAKTHADIVVMATHGRRGPQRLWLGSVAMKVTQGARVPVLLVRTKEIPMLHPAAAREDRPEIAAGAEPNTQ